MFINEINLLGFSSLLKIPITKLLFSSLLFSFFLYIFVKLLVTKQKYVKVVVASLLVLISFYYFSPMAVVILLTVFIGSILFGEKLFKFDDLTISFISGFFALIGAYILLAVISNFVAALLIILLISLGFLLFKRDKNKMIVTKLKKDFNYYLNTFNIIDYWAISLAFLIGSLPQSHWDAIHANLYNAKWYINNNSFSPLIESISSLFPQNAIGYYSFFFQSGGAKTLQIAYILPLVVLLIVFKKISGNLNFSKTSNLFGYLIIFTPIVIFQSSNGYYDLLIVLILVSVIYILYFQPSKSLVVNTLVASYLVGFAAAIKYFPLVMIFLPIISYVINKKRITTKTVLVGLFSMVLGLFPLTIWLLRSYVFTGSPVFPFYQTVFPTPDYWVGGELTNHFMIQTSMGSSEWLKGGFILYPILTYFRTESFMEATRGFPGIVYTLLIPVQILIAISIARKAINKKIQKRDIFYLYTFTTYIIVGLLSRYYRYLWPFQFVFSLVTLFYLAEAINNIKPKKVAVVAVILFMFLLNINDILGYFRFFPINPERLFQPDYFTKLSDNQNSISFLNNRTNVNQQDTILDASKYTLPRFHFNAKTHECNWYWINGINQVKMYAEKQRMIVDDFDYIITSNPPENDNNFCIPSLVSDIQQSKLIYSDQLYRIYSIK